MIEIELHGAPGSLQIRHFPIVPSIMSIEDLKYISKDYLEMTYNNKDIKRDDYLIIN